MSLIIVPIYYLEDVYRPWYRKVESRKSTQGEETRVGRPRKPMWRELTRSRGVEEKRKLKR